MLCSTRGCAMTDAALAPGISPIAQGRSLGSLALLRLLRNRAAMASLGVFCLITIFCVVGPWLSPHHYAGIYQSYVRVPASLEAYPRAESLQAAMQNALGQARVDMA